MLVEVPPLNFVYDDKVHAIFKSLQGRTHRLFGVGRHSFPLPRRVDLADCGPLLDRRRREDAVNTPRFFALVEQSHLVSDYVFNQVPEKEVAIIAQSVWRWDVKIAKERLPLAQGSC